MKLQGERSGDGKNPSKGGEEAYKGTIVGEFQLLEATAPICAGQDKRAEKWAQRYDLSYGTDTEVAQRQAVTIEGPQAPPVGTVFSKVGDGLKWVTVGEDGSIILQPGLDVWPRQYEVKVKATYSDGSSKEVTVLVRVNAGRPGSSAGSSSGKPGSGGIDMVVAAVVGAFGAIITLLLIVLGAVRAGFLRIMALHA